MSRIVVVGGSVAGLGCALVLAAQGHQVQVLERDRQAGDVSDLSVLRSGYRQGERRPGTPHAGHAHVFLPVVRDVLRRYAPDVLAELLAVGCREVPLADLAPGTSPEHESRPMALLARRAVFEAVMRRAVAQRADVTYSSGVDVRGLIFKHGGVQPRVAGVYAADGRRCWADVVIGATGRYRDPIPAWLKAGGVTAVQSQSEPCQFTMYTRFYQLQPGAEPGPLDDRFSLGGHHDAFGCKLLLADNDLFSVSFGVLPGDMFLKQLRHGEFFAAAAAQIPNVAAWLDPARGRPVTAEPLVMAGMRNQLRRLITPEGTPAVLGFYLVGDSLCTTNPVLARGVALALHQAVCVGEALQTYPTDVIAQAVAVDDALTELTIPWHGDAVVRDRGRADGWKRAIGGVADESGEETGRLPTRLHLLRLVGSGAHAG